jgi:iron-sulfur cluster assembly accessory protein
LHPTREFSIQWFEGWRLAVRWQSGDNTSREFTQQEILEMVQLTETAVSKVKEILGSQDPKPAGLRIAVVGGGCSGFSYSMAFENTPNMLDKTYKFDDLKVFIDQASLLYLDGAEVDYVETMEGSGFKFNNPNVKSTCGCGSSFSA